MPSIPPFEEVTNFQESVSGWVGTSQDRGSADILYSSCVTILLCCWVSTQPNACAPKDKWYHLFRDRLYLALIGLLSPDFIFAIAFGQLSSARRSVKAFQKDKHLTKGLKWTYRHAFFVDMGGIFLTSPDFLQGFPINAEQLYYLLKHDHVEFPDMNAMAIDERNTADTLSRLLTMWQVLWFSITEIQRAVIGLPMTTLELTALSYAFVIIVTSICWCRKPAITRPRYIQTKNNKKIDEIRILAKEHTHPNLDLEKWYRTPVDFISSPRWGMSVQWEYYVQVFGILRLPVISRKMREPLWDHFPSDIWLPPEPIYSAFGTFVLLWFSASFLIAWDFQFPTKTELILWRCCSLYTAFFMIYGAAYYIVFWYRWNARRKSSPATTLKKASLHQPPQHPTPFSTAQLGAGHVQACNIDVEVQTTCHSRSKKGISGLISRLYILAAQKTNISSNQDPEMAVSWRVLVPVTIMSILYILCRLSLYVEDFLSLREQPIGVYYTVNRFVPFMGD